MVPQRFLEEVAHRPGELDQVLGPAALFRLAVLEDPAVADEELGQPGPPRRASVTSFSRLAPWIATPSPDSKWERSV